ncbi:unnamed protein product [Didymodactylos carnosus]|uniref:Uncharacterized protein n=1 Tax=Didymodactylos carnosus TaxID=1234261 RepID=A0A813PZT5_9BILA|nr:unnamed protein product [Didymodactylos carnosus]CAF3541491.1 unnamed protein product [Didymodactylos carnosus]
MGTRERWQDKITEDLEKLNIRNWRRETLDKDKWRATINRLVHSNDPSSNISEVVQQYKQKADKRRAASNVPLPPKVTEVLIKQGLKNTDGAYTCPNSKCTRRTFRAQGIIRHVKACAPEWCKKHKIPTN